jgi:hypothetical protein
MSMVFAGFMNAAKEDRVREEEAQQKTDAADDAFDRSVLLQGIEQRNAQGLIDAQLGRDVTAVIDAFGYDRSQAEAIANGLLLFGGDVPKFRQAITDGEVSFPGNVTPTAVGTGDYVSPTNSLTGLMAQYADATAAVESRGSGDYSAIGPKVETGMYAGQSAIGRYQVMEGNISAWTTKYLGRTLTTQQFIDDTEAQDQVFAGKFGESIEEFGSPQDAASVWFSGQPMANNNNNDGFTSVPEYIVKFNTALRELNDTSVTDATVAALGDGSPVSTDTGITFNRTADFNLADQTGTPAQQEAFRDLYGSSFTPEQQITSDRILERATTAAADSSAPDINDLVDMTSAEQEQWMLAHGDNLTAIQRGQATGMLELSRASEVDPDATGISQYGDAIAGVTTVARAKALQARASVDDSITEEELNTLNITLEGLIVDLEAEDPNDSGIEYFATRVGEATTTKALIALSQELELSGLVTEEERARIAGAIIISMDRLKTAESLAAANENNGSQRLFLTYDSDGTVSNNITPIVHNGTEWVTQNGTAIDESTGTIVDPDSVQEERKLYNTPLNDMSEKIVGGQLTTDHLLELSSVIRQRPEGLNNVLSAAGSAVGIYSSVTSAVAAITNGSTDETEVYDYNTASTRLIESIQGLTEYDRAIMSLQLTAAYSLAAMKGSSGQALSDRELQLNLTAVGFGITNPDKSITQINTSINDVMREMEIYRNSTWIGLSIPPDRKAAIQNDLLRTPFEDFVRGTVYADNPERQQLLQRSLEGDTTLSSETAAAVVPGATVEQLITDYSSGVPITVTQELVEAYPDLIEDLGKTIVNNEVGSQ